MTAPPIWRPSAERVRTTNLTAFLAFLRDRKLSSAADYPQLHAWSIAAPERFWPAVWEFCGVRASRLWDVVVDDPTRMPGARWFAGARLSFAENLLARQGAGEALVFWNERGRQSAWTGHQLSAAVARTAAALAACGVGAGDRVAGFLPNLPETVVAMLATAAVGATWSSCSPDFGVQGVLDRFGQIEPKVLFAADGYLWNGREVGVLGRLAEIVAALPTVERVVVVPYLAAAPDLDALAAVRPAQLLADFQLAPASQARYTQLPFDHPLYVLYSSGTTGLPKCLVHGAGGTLLQHLKELVLHTDLKPGDRIFYHTTCGWMMWNWLLSSLAVGATVLLYDGSPLPAAHAGVLWQMAAAEGVTIFGTSARYLALAEKQGLHPAAEHDLRALRTVLSTGSPLAPESYDYVYRRIKGDVCLSSISGGTDLISCFALGNPLAAVYRGELQALGLGMKVEVYDPAGRPLAAGKGELVCTQAFPSMPVGFWRDPGGERYRRAYFEHFPGVWRHGDWAERTAHGGLIIHGRSDATLNPGGVRIGSAEICRQVEQLDEVVESLVVGQAWQGDTRIVLFVRLRPGLTLDDALTERIRGHVRAQTTPRHVPARVVQVADLPRTVNGKLSELAVRNVLQGLPVDNANALANPEALELFRNLPALRE